MSAIGTDIALTAIDVRFWGVKRTCRFALHMSAYDPKRTLIRHNATEYLARRLGNA